MEFLFADWLGTPVWFWLAFLGLVAALTAFDLGILHKEDRVMGVAESLKLSAFYIGLVFTAVSLVRQYLLRRVFNRAKFGNAPA